MFDKLEDLVDRLDTLNNQLTDPDIVLITHINYFTILIDLCKENILLSSLYISTTYCLRS